MATNKQPGRTKKTVTKSPIKVSLKKFIKEYDKNFGKLLDENSSKIVTAREKSNNGNGGVEVIKKLAEKAHKETSKQLGFTNSEAIERYHQKKGSTIKAKAAAKARATVDKYRKGSYKK